MVANTLKVNTVKLILGREVGDGLDEGRAVLASRDGSGEIEGTRPATHGDERFDTLERWG